MGAIIMLGVTIAIGFAAWAWARGASVSSEDQLINSTSENYEIINVNFSSSSPQKVTVWFYNSGSVTVYIKQLLISNETTKTSLQWTYLASSTSSGVLSNSNVPNCGYCLSVPKGTVVTVTLTATESFASGVVYQYKALGEYGTTYTYTQER
jgi:hypothetical protein